MKVIGIDPGQTTGLSVYSADTVRNPDDEIEIYNETWQMSQLGPAPHHQALALYLELQHSDHDIAIVCESFEFRNRARAGLVLDSVEYIGVVRFIAEQRGIPLIMQTAGMAKTFISDANLKHGGLYRVAHRHANDATRHVLYYLINTHHRYDLLKLVGKGPKS